MTEEDVQHYKIIFLGDQYVGKSSILNRFYQDRFEPDYQATIGLDFHSKNVEIKGTTIRLLLYDTAGQEKFKSLIPMYIRDANIIIVVYDISNKDSFIHTDHWVNETKDLKREDAIFVLVGNKIDLEDKRAVSQREAEDFAAEKGFLFHEVSAKTGDEIQELFNTVIFPEMAKKFKIGDEEEEGNAEQGEKKADNVVLGQGEGQTEEGKRRPPGSDRKRTGRTGGEDPGRGKGGSLRHAGRPAEHEGPAGRREPELAAQTGERGQRCDRSLQSAGRPAAGHVRGMRAVHTRCRGRDKSGTVQ